MMLKNRLTALIAVVALAVPTVVYARGKFSKKGSDSVVTVAATAPGVSFNAVGKNDAITIEDDGTTIKVLVDGHKLKTDSDLRDKHMKKQVFGKGKTIALTVTHADLDAGLAKGGNVKGSLKFSDKPAINITIDGASVKDGVVKGHFKVTRSQLGIPEACLEPVGIPCVHEGLEVNATLKVSE